MYPEQYVNHDHMLMTMFVPEAQMGHGFEKINHSNHSVTQNSQYFQCGIVSATVERPWLFNIKGSFVYPAERYQWYQSAWQNYRIWGVCSSKSYITVLNWKKSFECTDWWNRIGWFFFSIIYFNYNYNYNFFRILFSITITITITFKS